jgi:hypothetical protein
MGVIKLQQISIYLTIQKCVYVENEHFPFKLQVTTWDQDRIANKIIAKFSTRPMFFGWVTDFRKIDSLEGDTFDFISITKRT